MNQRIQELYIKTLSEECSNPALVDIEKFAELIVQECAEIARHNVMNISTYSDAEFVSDLIHQHFGVKA